MRHGLFLIKNGMWRSRNFPDIIMWSAGLHGDSGPRLWHLGPFVLISNVLMYSTPYTLSALLRAYWLDFIHNSKYLVLPSLFFKYLYCCSITRRGWSSLLMIAYALRGILREVLSSLNVESRISVTAS